MCRGASREVSIKTYQPHSPRLGSVRATAEQFELKGYDMERINITNTELLAFIIKCELA